MSAKVDHKQWENPVGTDGFDFVEYAAPDATLLHELFTKFGFSRVAKHANKNIFLYRQGEINFLVNDEPDSFAFDFAKQHGPCAVGFGMRVKDADQALKFTVERGASAFKQKVDSLPVETPAIEGIGGSALYLVDRYGDSTLFDDYVFETEDRFPKGLGLTYIDHLTHNVFQGNMDKWAGFYEKLFNFREIRYFDIKGAKTGLFSRAMTSPDGMVRIPINESADEQSQIAEYLNEYDGEGIQHIALFTDNIYDSVEGLRSHGVKFMEVPDTYYDLVEKRIPNHKEDLPRLGKNKILIDADLETKKQLLLQIFTETNIGPIFFEIIQRKGNEGFGEGNFTALFESIELDQQKRGVL